MNKKIKTITSILTFFLVVLANFSVLASSPSHEIKKIENQKPIHKQKSNNSSKTSSNNKSKIGQNITEQSSKNNNNINKDSNNSDSNSDDGMVQITDAYARGSIPGSKNSALFMKVKNLTEQNLTIIDVHAKEVARKTELHTTIKDKETGIMKMQKVNEIVVEAKKTAEFKSGGDHVMLLDLKKELKENDDFEASVSFKEIEPVKFTVKVKNN
jgi:periplasmic copper chaperone A